MHLVRYAVSSRGVHTNGQLYGPLIIARCVALSYVKESNVKESNDHQMANIASSLYTFPWKKMSMHIYRDPNVRIG